MQGVCDKLAPVMDQHGSAAQRARFHHTRALKNLRQDRYRVSDETLNLSRYALSAAQQDAPTELPMLQFFHGFALLFHGAPERADTELEAATVLAKRAGDFEHQARCLTYQAICSRRRGLVEQTERLSAIGLAIATKSGMREYQAAALANQAWVASRREDFNASWAAASQARGLWRELSAVFPFEWLALLPLITEALRRDSLPAALGFVAELLIPTQHWLPDDGADLLRSASLAWEAGNGTDSAKALTAALRCLAPAGYE
jgi:hypothetical protein